MNDYRQDRWRSALKVLGTSFWMSGIVWLIVTWPLARYVREGIPASHRGPASETVRYMIPGDHLQLLYHFWLVSDMLKGQTPWGYNLYEFNDGDDNARKERGGWYLPFSLVYALAAEFGGRAFGWNFAGFFSVWVSAIFVLLLARRYVAIPAVQRLATFVGVAFLYRWIMLMGGSPTGFAMAWPPAIFWGIDVWVRDGSARGSIAAGLGLIAAGAGDPQLFFFCTLAVPVFVCLAFLGIRDFSSVWIWGWWRKRVVTGLWLALALGLAVPVTAGTAGAVENVAQSGGRKWEEVVLFSPKPSGLFFHQGENQSNHIFLGGVVIALAALCFGLIFYKGLRDQSNRMVWWTQGVLLLACLLGVVLLALGPYGPWEGLALRVVRKLLPPYRLIRQTAKVYCLVPTLLAYMTMLGLHAIPRFFRTDRDWPLNIFTILIATVYLFDIKKDLHPHVCLLKQKQDAYAAVLSRAVQENQVARALVIPLWPGDSHYPSVYQYYASLYRVRMVNGYRPFVSASYISNVFLRFESANQGHFTNAQLDELLNRGIRAVLLHEDLYPEKVAPFPVGVALHSLLSNPRLQLIERDHSVWAFEILPDNATNSLTEPGVFEGYFPAWRWYPRAWRSVGDVPIAFDPEKFRLSGEGTTVEFRRSMALAPYPRLRLDVLCAGSGSVDVHLGSQPVATIEVGDEKRAWYEVSLDAVREFQHYVPRLVGRSGVVDVYEMVLLAGDPLRPLRENREVSWPAAWFFRAGWSDPLAGTVVLEPLEAPADEVFYGPRLRLPPGEYEVELAFDTDAPDGQHVGSWRVEKFTAPVPVVAGQHAVLNFHYRGHELFSIRFRFLGTARVKLQRISLRRLGEPHPADGQRS